MSVSVNPPAKPAPKKKKPTLQSRLDDALADAAGIEAELDDALARIKQLEEDLRSQSHGVEYAEEYAEHNKKRNAEMNKLRSRLDRRDDRIATMEAEKTTLEDHIADLEEQAAINQRIIAGMEMAIDVQTQEYREANDKIAEHAQTVVTLREQLAEANAESAHNAQAARRLTEQVNALERTLEKQHAALTDTITARGVRIDDLDLENEVLRADNARLKAVEYLHKRPSYVRGALSAVRAARNLFGRGGAQ